MELYKAPAGEQLEPPPLHAGDWNLSVQIFLAGVLLVVAGIGTFIEWLWIVGLAIAMGLNSVTSVPDVAVMLAHGQVLLGPAAAVCALGLFMKWRWSFNASVRVSVLLMVIQIAACLGSLTGFFVPTNKVDDLLLLLPPMVLAAVFSTVTAVTCWNVRRAWVQRNQLELARLVAQRTKLREELDTA